MIVSKEQFQKIISDFDGFMAENGYVKAEVLAKKFNVTPITVRQWSYRGKIPDPVYIGDRQYVKDVNIRPVDLRKSYSGRHKMEEEE